MEGRFGYVVLTARYFYVTALVHLTKDFDDLIYSVSFLFHDSGRVLARQSLIFNGPVYGGQVTFRSIRMKLLDEGKTLKYLKYAIGEIALMHYDETQSVTVKRHNALEN